MTIAFHFRMRVDFHFAEHNENRRRFFVVGEDCHRHVPVEMEGVEALNTVGMWFENPSRYEPGESAVVNCAVITPQIFYNKIAKGTKGRLWDGGFFADVEVIEVYHNELKEAALKAMQ